MRTPYASYDISNNDVTDECLEKNAWSGIIDQRYKVEVQRTEPYQGILCVWDGKNNDALIFEKEVSISYNAAFGVDVADVREWQDVVCDFIDNANLPAVS